MPTIIDLNGAWDFRMLYPESAQNLPSEAAPGAATAPRASDFMQARVPGCVHLDLMRHGLIPDPFRGRNEHEVQWVAQRDWVYRRTFAVPEHFLSHERVDLLFEGLDTFARIHLNGKLTGSTDDMFVPWRFDAREALQEGRNELEVAFLSPVVQSRRLSEKYGKLNGPFDTHCVCTRKAHYSYGWDWAPRLPTSGIWKAVRIEAWDSARLSGIGYRTSLDESLARVALAIDVQSTRREEVRLCASLSRGEWSARAHLDVRLDQGHNQANLEIPVDVPDLWWPNGMGEPSLYSLHLVLERDGSPLDDLTIPVGLRSVRLIELDEERHGSFLFEINGRKVFCKGANWVPADSLLPRISPQRYDALVKAARDANMNMLRVWGGGIYEDEAFYNACDRYGIMVWQDFMFSCGEYPEADDFLSKIRREAELAVSRLRRHPSIVLWCGNNECLWNVCGPKAKNASGSGKSIYYHILPEVCAGLDGTRPYWPGSPASSRETLEDPDSPQMGDQHLWSVWSGWQDYSGYARFDGTFLSEFGIQAPPDTKTIRAFSDVPIPPSDITALEHHNKQDEGYERIYRFLAGHFRVPSNLYDFAYLAQLNQAEGLKRGVEHWRKRMYRTAGTLFWQFNDCWPAVSWSVLDYYLRPKAAYYYARRFFAPVLLLLQKDEDVVSIWTVSDRRETFDARLETRHISTRGPEFASTIDDIQVPHGANLAAEIVCDTVRPEEDLIAARLLLGDETAAQATLLFVEPKHLYLPPTRIHYRLDESPDGPITLTLSADKFAKDVRISIPAFDAAFSDNFFDLLPGWEKSVKIDLPPGASLSSLREGLAITHLGLIR